ncbi:MAG: lysine--tRNA ligase [Chlamydiota bacterium]
MSMKPHYHDQEDFQVRLQKLREIRDLGIDPYPHQFPGTTPVERISESFLQENSFFAEEASEGLSPSVRASGRLVLFRSMGKNAFAQIQENGETIQLMFNKERTKVEGLNSSLGMAPMKFIEKKLDLGDIIGVEGNLFRTKKGETTIYVKTLTLLTKALLPLPDKHAGLQDLGIRYQKRWLDLLATKESVARFKKRSQILHEIRLFMEKKEFLSVETPILQDLYGGAQADPFCTQLNAAHKPMYLRIALEIALKKLLVGGLPRIYEIGKNFRNEGIDRTHNPEFTMLEAYAANWDYKDMMAFVEELFSYLARSVLGSETLSVGKHTISLGAPWKRMSMKESLAIYANIDFDALSDDELSRLLVEKSARTAEELCRLSRGSLMALCFEEFVESHLIEPHHIIDHPIETTPFCKLHRGEKERKEKLVERFESFLLGTEMVNAYSELNDPLLQRSLLEAQQAHREGEPQPLDEEFLEAICQGMPPSAGVGIGIDRLVMLLTGTSSIKDVLFFPL